MNDLKFHDPVQAAICIKGDNQAIVPNRRPKRMHNPVAFLGAPV